MSLGMFRVSHLCENPTAFLKNDVLQLLTVNNRMSVVTCWSKIRHNFARRFKWAFGSVFENVDEEFPVTPDLYDFVRMQYDVSSTLLRMNRILIVTAERCQRFCCFSVCLGQRNPRRV